MISCPRCKKKCQIDEKRCSRCGASLPIPSPAKDDSLARSDSGLRIGDYKVINLLAVGGPGTTQIAERESQEFLLKHVEIGEGSDAATIVDIFRRECKILAGLKHRGLPQIVKHDLHENGLFLYLSLCNGTSLLDFIYPETKPNTIYPTDRQVLPDLERIIRWSTQLAEILAFLHGQKPFPIIHRNLNPLTVRVTKPAEDIKLLDFGIQSSFRAATPNITSALASPMDNFDEPELLMPTSLSSIIRQDH